MPYTYSEQNGKHSLFHSSNRTKKSKKFSSSSFIIAKRATSYARTRYLVTVCPQGLTPSIWPQWDLFALEYVKMRQVFAVIYCSKKIINLNPQITVFCLPTRYNSMNYAFLLECFQLKLKVLRKCVFRVLAIHILVDFVKFFLRTK